MAQTKQIRSVILVKMSNNGAIQGSKIGYSLQVAKTAITTLEQQPIVEKFQQVTRTSPASPGIRGPTSQNRNPQSTNP